MVGVGGLILGGGYFHTSGQFGLAADNVKSFELVKSNGDIIKAPENQPTDPHHGYPPADDGGLAGVESGKDLSPSRSRGHSGDFLVGGEANCVEPLQIDQAVVEDNW